MRGAVRSRASSRRWHTPRIGSQSGRAPSGSGTSLFAVRLFSLLLDLTGFSMFSLRCAFGSDGGARSRSALIVILPRARKHWAAGRVHAVRGAVRVRGSQFVALASSAIPQARHDQVRQRPRYVVRAGQSTQAPARAVGVDQIALRSTSAIPRARESPDSCTLVAPAPASLFVSFGPTTRQAIRRIFRRDFLTKMRARAPRMYGVRTRCSGRSPRAVGEAPRPTTAEAAGRGQAARLRPRRLAGQRRPWTGRRALKTSALAQAVRRTQGWPPSQARRAGRSRRGLHVQDELGFAFASGVAMAPSSRADGGRPTLRSATLPTSDELLAAAPRACTSPTGTTRTWAEHLNVVGVRRSGDPLRGMAAPLARWAARARSHSSRSGCELPNTSRPAASSPASSRPRQRGHLP
jgi:hypothetical protein